MTGGHRSRVGGSSSTRSEGERRLSARPRVGVLDRKNSLPLARDHLRCRTGHLIPHCCAGASTTAASFHDAEGLGGTPRHRLTGDLEGLVALEVVLQQVHLSVGLDFESFGIDGLAEAYPGARGAIHYDS